MIFFTSEDLHPSKKIAPYDAMQRIRDFVLNNNISKVSIDNEED